MTSGQELVRSAVAKNGKAESTAASGLRLAPDDIWSNPTGLNEVEPFPLDDLPDPVGPMVRAVAHFTQTAPDLGAA